MIIRQKKSVEIFSPLILKNIPECKRQNSGIRPRSIAKPPSRAFQENVNVKRSVKLDNNIQENITANTRSQFKVGKFLIKNKKPPSVPIVPSNKQSNFAFFSFLPDIDNDLLTNSTKSSKRSKSSYRYGRDSSYLRKFLQPKRIGNKSVEKKSVEELFVDARTEKNKEVDSRIVTPQRWTQEAEDSEDEEESPLRDYLNILKPRFNNL